MGARAAPRSPSCTAPRQRANSNELHQPCASQRRVHAFNEKPQACARTCLSGHGLGVRRASARDCSHALGNDGHNSHTRVRHPTYYYSQGAQGCG